MWKHARQVHVCVIIARFSATDVLTSIKKS